jgi:hypothetical protein
MAPQLHFARGYIPAHVPQQAPTPHLKTHQATKPKAPAKAQPTLTVTQAELRQMITTAVNQAMDKVCHCGGRSSELVTQEEAWMPADDPDWGTPKPLVTMGQDDGPADDPDWS